MKLTTDQYIAKLNADIKKILDPKFIFDAAADAHATQVDRVFNKGIGGDNARIGSYDTTHPLYISPSQTPRKVTNKGKSGETTFKNGKAHKTAYFGSYKEFRAAVGRETAFVNLRLSEQLKQDFTNSLQPFQGGYISGVKRRENAEKVDGLSEKYGLNTFKLTEGEKKAYAERVKQKIIDTFNS